MVDDRHDGSGPDAAVPDNATETGVQRALGERRRRRLAERSGQVSLDATMSQWPVLEPPAAPRPVVRPARPTRPDVATAPVLPTPSALVVGPLLEARGARPAATSTGGRRARRLAAQSTQDDGPAPSQAGSTGSAAATGTPATTGTTAGEHGHEPDWDHDLLGPGEATRPANGRAGHTRDRRVAPGHGLDPLDDELAPAGGRPAPTPSPAGARAGTIVAGVPDEPRSGHWAPAAVWRRLRGGRATRLDLLAVAGVLVALLLVVALVVALLRPSEDPAAVSAPSDAPAQRTLGLALSDAQGSVRAGALLGVDSARATTLLVPEDLRLTVADAGRVTLAQTAEGLGATSLRRGLEDTLGVRVDEVVVVTAPQLSALVDAVGGVVVDVSREVVTEEVVVPAGDDQRLAGAQAALYATDAAPDEPVEAPLARFSAVLVALLESMPSDPDDAAAVLASAGVAGSTGDDGAGAPPSPAAGSVDEGVAEVLAAAAGRAGAGGAEAVVVPTRVVTAGDGSARSVDPEALSGTLTARFAGALLPVAAVGETLVVVRNGVGTPGLLGEARDRLVAAGLRFAGGGNAPSFGEESTVVLVASSEAEDRAQGEAVAAALGLPPDSLQVNSQDMVDTDVVVVLGEDFAQLVSTPAGESS